MRVLDRGQQRLRRKIRVERGLASRRNMRNHARVARRQLRTSNYSEEARRVLGKAVEDARLAAGYKYRTDFCRAHNIKSLRSLELLEQGKTGVGQAFLFQIADALPGWTRETPKIILEGGDPPPPQTVPADESVPTPRSRPRPDVPNKGDLTEHELEFMWALSKSGFSAEEIVEMVRQRRERNQLQSGMDVGQAGESSA